MKGLKWLLVPVVVMAGLCFVAPNRAEAARWSVHVGGVYPHYAGHYAYRYRAPRCYGWPAPVVAPVYAAPVYRAPVYPAPVIVAPRPYRAYYARPPVPFYHVW